MNPNPPDKVSAYEGLRIILNNPENRGPIRNLVLTTIAMVFIPLVTYVLFRDLDRFLGVYLFHQYLDRYTIGGIASIISVQIIMVVFVILAFREKDERLEPLETKKTK